MAPFLMGIVNNGMGMTVQILRKGSEIVQGFPEGRSQGACESPSVRTRVCTTARSYGVMRVPFLRRILL